MNMSMKANEKDRFRGSGEILCDSLILHLRRREVYGKGVSHFYSEMYWLQKKYSANLGFNLEL